MRGTHGTQWLVALCFALSGAAVQAQSYPTRPVKLLVGFTPGGGVDINAGKKVAVRLAQFDYIPTRFSGFWFHNFRYEAGIVFMVGGK